MTAESLPRSHKPFASHKRGTVQFRLNQELSTDVLGRVLRSESLESMRRRQGGFFYARVPYEIPFLPDGMASNKQHSGDHTLRERLSDVMTYSKRLWSKDIAVHGLATTYLYSKKNVERKTPDAVSLQLLFDEEDHQRLLTMLKHLMGGQKLTANDEHDYRLTPNVILPVPQIEVPAEDEINISSDPTIVSLVSLQNVVTKLNRSASESEKCMGALEVPATFHAPRQ